MRVPPDLPALAVAGMLLLGACGTGGGGSAAPAGASVSAGATGSSPGPAPAILAFTAATVDGAPFDGASLAGKPAVLWFWSPWCPTCGAEAPQVAGLAERYAGKVGVVGVAGLDDIDGMRQFVARTKVSGFPNVADEKGEVWRRFGVTAQATYVLLDASARVVYRGFLDGDQLDDRVGRLAG